MAMPIITSKTVAPIFIQSISQLLVRFFSVTKWSWRESNPRPNRETIRFLHAYLGLHCRAVTRPKPPITALSSKTSSPSRGSQETISDLPAPLYLPDSEQHPEERCLVLSPCKRIKPVIYCTSIRQRERTLFRQLIVRPT